MTNLLAEALDVGRVFESDGGRVIALQHATCKIGRCDRIALVGPSGSGKSTLLHLFAALDSPTSGTLRWPALGAKSALRPSKIAFVFQSESLVSSLTVLENVEAPLLLAGADAKVVRRNASAMLESFDLTAIADKLPEEISGGQAQRVAVARSLVIKPDLILADEPTGQLDHTTAARVLDLIDSHLQGTDAALVIATHDPFVAGRMKTRWRMDHGVLR